MLPSTVRAACVWVTSCACSNAQATTVLDAVLVSTSGGEAAEDAQTAQLEVSEQFGAELELDDGRIQLPVAFDAFREEYVGQRLLVHVNEGEALFSATLAEDQTIGCFGYGQTPLSRQDAVDIALNTDASSCGEAVIERVGPPPDCDDTTCSVGPNSRGWVPLVVVVIGLFRLRSRRSSAVDSA